MAFTVAALFLLVLGPTAWVQAFPTYGPVASEVSEFGPSSQTDVGDEADFWNQLLYRQLKRDENGRKWPINIPKSKFPFKPVVTPSPKRTDKDAQLTIQEYGQQEVISTPYSEPAVQDSLLLKVYLQ